MIAAILAGLVTLVGFALLLAWLSHRDLKRSTRYHIKP
jgi:hypothetical protein